MVDVSERKKADRRKQLKEMLKAIDQVFNTIKLNAQKGEVPRDQQLRFLKDYPGIRAEYEGLIAESLKEEKEILDEDLKIFVERIWRLKEIGDPDEVMEATGYYKCDNCGQLHVKERKCMYLEFKEIKEDEEVEL